MDSNSNQRKLTQPQVPFNKVGRFDGQKRKRPENDGDASSDDETTVIRMKRFRRANPLTQSTMLLKKSPAKCANSSDSQGEYDEDNAPMKAPSKLAQTYQAAKTGERLGPRDMGATATNEIDTDFDRDAPAMFMKNLKCSKDWQKKADDTIYRGMNAYTNFLKVRDRPSGNVTSGMVQRGPIRAPKHIHQTILVDYRPDICKDYRETGFCCFGDSCKFLHDRSDYKHGWEIEREWAQRRYGKQQEENYEISDEGERKFPIKCAICRDSFKTPIITTCKHYFCQQCAIDHFHITPHCFTCGAPTYGICNPARELIAKLKGAKLREGKGRK